MHDQRLDQLAKVLVHYSTRVRRDELVVITGAACCEPAVAAVYREVLRAGGHPWVRLVSEHCKELHVRHGSDTQLRFCSPFDKHVISACNVYISLWGEENTRALTSVDPKRQQLASLARKPWLKTFLKREGLPPKDPRRLRWVGTQYPTNAAAQDAEMSLAEYADFVFRAGKLHQPDPVAAWKTVGVAQQRLADHLNKCSELRYRTPRGTDIRFGIAGRKWINCRGESNFPDGEVFTGPIEDATEGVVQFDFPAVTGGREVLDVRLVFRAGRVVEASASKNEAFLLKMLDQDKGARILGEVAIGTNYDIRNFTRNTLFDEKIGGTVHMAVGAAYPATGGTNESALHWDMVCDLRQGGTIEADGKIISRNGKFTRAEWPK